MPATFESKGPATDLHADAHAWSIARVFPRIGETGTTRQIIDLRAADQAVAVGAGIVSIGLVSVRMFGRFQGGNSSTGG